MAQYHNPPLTTNVASRARQANREAKRDMRVETTKREQSKRDKGEE